MSTKAKTVDLKHFSLSEFKCSHCGEVQMDEEFLVKLDELRDRCGFPFVVTSGYRCSQHPVERVKQKPGMHTEGKAADIEVQSGHQRYLIIAEATALRFKGIGVGDDFIHVDTRATPTAWSY